MKKFVMIAAVAMTSATYATPASAQSANDWMRYDEARDPGYQSAIRGGGNRYYNQYNDAPNSNSQQDMSCVQVFIFYSKCNVKPRPMNCYTANGDMTVTDESGTRFVGGANSGRPVPREVAITCGGNTYRASN